MPDRLLLTYRRVHNHPGDREIQGVWLKTETTSPNGEAITEAAKFLATEIIQMSNGYAEDGKEFENAIAGVADVEMHVVTTVNTLLDPDGMDEIKRQYDQVVAESTAYNAAWQEKHERETYDRLRAKFELAPPAPPAPPAPTGGAA